MRVLIVGDVHGQHRKLAALVRQVEADYRIGAAIQVGDFGFTRALLARRGETRVAYAVPLHVIDGNHEDHAWLQRALVLGAARTWQNECNLIYQPRPSVAEIGGGRVGFLGGALHADRPQQHNLLSGFPNYILRRQREAAVALFNRERPELIVTHSCPAGIGIGLRGSAELEPSVGEHVVRAGFAAGPPDDCGEEELNRLWTGLAYRPRAWVFGHFHRPHRVTIGGTDFVCAGDELEDPRRTLLLWDTREKRILACPADPSVAPAG